MGTAALSSPGFSGESSPAIRDEEIQVVEFLLGTEKYAVNLFDVKEIVEYTQITPVPGSDRYITGIIDLRGEITTILDLKAKLQVSSSQTNPEQSRIIVIDSSVTQAKTGILVDDVTTVLTVDPSQIDYDTCKTMDSAHILGIIRNSRGSGQSDLIIWIDIPGMLRDMGL